MERVAVPHSPPGDAIALATANPSAVAWGAVLAGAAGAASLSLALAFLGLGLGMASISPWAGNGASAETLGIGSILWITLTQIAAASLGGYLAGRLRTRWQRTHSDEVYFRDTAHGFLAWSIATLATAALLASVIAGVATMGAQVGAATVRGAGTAAAAVAANGAGRAMDENASDDAQGYLLDSLFRPATFAPTATADPATAPVTGDARNARSDTRETARIFGQATRSGSLSAADSRYLANVIAQRTGLTPDEAEARVRSAYADWQKAVTSAKEAADKARKATAYAALWLFIALLGGAFFASLCATWGGKRRDAVD